LKNWKLSTLKTWWFGNLKTGKLENNQIFNKKVKLENLTDIYMYNSKN